MWWRIESRGMSPQRMVEHVDVLLRTALLRVVIGGRIGQDLHQPRVVDLQHEPGVDDGEVLDAHRFTDRRQVLAVGRVVLVPAETARTRRRHERLERRIVGERRVQVGDVGLELVLTDVADRSRAHELLERGDGTRVLLEVLVVEAGKVGDLLAPRRRQDHVAVVLREPTETVLDVGEEAHLAHLAVGDDVESALDLTVHAVGDGIAHLTIERGVVVGLAGLLVAHHLEQLDRSCQAPHVGGDDPLRAAVHVRLPSTALSGPVPRTCGGCHMARIVSPYLRCPVANAEPNAATAAA